jgi:hypothetical protein
MPELTPQNANRLAKAIMQRHGVDYARACQILTEFKLHLICGEEVHESPSLQAAVLTAINTGKRAFLGGVMIDLPPDVPLRLPWPGSLTLNDVAHELGAVATVANTNPMGRTLIFGGTKPVTESSRVICDGWRGGVSPADTITRFKSGPDFALGGVFAGAFAVARAFLSVSEISHRDISEPTGFSLWRPDIHWMSADAIGPQLEGLPAQMWLLGLGHLGQAYAWTLGLLPFRIDRPSVVYLQDFDLVEEGNWSAGLLCESAQVGKYKTRMSAEWLEKRGFRTRLVERSFDEHTRRIGSEPRIALCGFDNPEARQSLEDAGFELIVDCGLGASLERFDRIVVRTFPDASATARSVFSNIPAEGSGLDPLAFGEQEGECGVVLQEIAGKAISSSFTGACAASCVIGEVLRAIHGGRRCEFFNLHLRELDIPTGPFREENYMLRVARNGVISVPQGSLSQSPNDLPV